MFGALIGTLTAIAAIVSLPVAARHAVELLDAPGITGTPAAEFAIGLPAIARLLSFIATLIALIGVAVARHGVHGDDRRTYTTVLVGAAVVVAMFIVDALVPVIFGQQHALPEAAVALALLALPASIAIAVVRFQLYDLRTFVNRSVLVALTGVALSAVYLGVLTLLAAAVGDSTSLTVPGILAAGAVVLVSAPVAAALTRMTRGWFGRGSPPAAMATRFAEQLLVDDDPLATARALAETMRCRVAARLDRTGRRGTRQHQDRRAERTGHAC